MAYTLKWSRGYAGNGEDVLKILERDFRKREYPDIDKARAAARRQVKFIVGFYEMAVLKDGKTIGWVVFDSQYRYGNASGIFWIPKGSNHESARVKGVNANGTLNNITYRLT